MRIMEKQDTDSNGVIDFGEFLKIMKENWKEPATQRDLIEAFKLVDADNSGTITTKELTKFLCSFGEPLTEAEVKQVVDRYDQDKDGTLNYAEFLTTLMRSQKNYSN